MSRREELEANLRDVRARIATACHAAGRAESEVTLVVVTKTWPASDVRLLAGLGISDVAENRDQEASAKAAELADLPLRWHFIGRLQRNKARSVVRYADVVESVDRAALVDALAVAVDGQAGLGPGARPFLDVLVQVSLDGEPGRGGALPDEVPGLANRIAGTARLRLRGVMAVAPLGGDPDAAFETLAAVAGGVRRAHPEATAISAGMSGDLEDAIRHGATHVRVGTAVLGGRAAVG